MTGNMLAEAVTAQGVPLTRSTLANLETGRRGDISTTELVAFARALQTTAGELLEPSPCGTCQDAPPAGFQCTACGTTGGVA